MDRQTLTITNTLLIPWVNSLGLLLHAIQIRYPATNHVATPTHLGLVPWGERRMLQEPQKHPWVLEGHLEEASCHQGVHLGEPYHLHGMSKEMSRICAISGLHVHGGLVVILQCLACIDCLALLLSEHHNQYKPTKPGKHVGMCSCACTGITTLRRRPCNRTSWHHTRCRHPWSARGSTRRWHSWHWTRWETRPRCHTRTYTKEVAITTGSSRQACYTVTLENVCDAHPISSITWHGGPRHTRAWWSGHTT